MKSFEAYEFIRCAIDTLLNLKDELTINYCIIFIHRLYGHVDTTEIHPDLEVKWDDIVRHVLQYCDDNEMKELDHLKRLVRK